MANTDNVSPGPKRWERALNGAKNNPTSGHAKLFFERLERVKDLSRDPDYWVVRCQFQGNHYYCSDFCAGLAINLEAYVDEKVGKFSSYEDIITEIRSGMQSMDIGSSFRVHVLEHVSLDGLTRAVKCFVCGGKMSKTIYTCDEPLVDFDDALWLLEKSKSKSYTFDVIEIPEPKVVEEKKVTVFLDNVGNILLDTPPLTEAALTERELFILQYVAMGDRKRVVELLEQL